MKPLFALCVCLPFGALGCDVAMDPAALRPSLTQTVADPALLAELCGVEVGALGPVSGSRLSLSSIAAKRPLVGSEGSGTAEVEYRPLAEGLANKACRGRLRFDFSDDASARHYSFSNVRVEGN